MNCTWERRIRRYRLGGDRAESRVRHRLDAGPNDGERACLRVHKQAAERLLDGKATFRLGSGHRSRI